MKRLLRCTLTVVVGCFGLMIQGVLAGTVILYEQADLSGRQIRLDTSTADLERLGFNDRAWSMRVLAGVWELCSDSFYRGNCGTFGPGEYRKLEDYLVRRVSSAREVQSGIDRPPALPADGALVLFEQEGFRGRRMGADGAVNDLDRLGFNDRTASVIVRRGNWELCTDADFRGRCRVFPPGQYASLGLELSDRISSARPVRYGGDSRPPSIRPPIGGPRPPQSPGDWFGTPPGELIVFEHDNFRGQSRTIHNVASDFDRVGFNDMVSSLLVRRGVWLVCTDADFRGTCRTYGPGEYRSVGPQLNDKFSSARPIAQ
jgi:hypothetical protein